MKLVWILSFLFLSSCSSNANEIAVENDAGYVILNQAFQMTRVTSLTSPPTKPIVVDLTEPQISGMLIVRKVDPIDEATIRLEEEKASLDFLAIDFLEFEFEKNPIIETSIKSKVFGCEDIFFFSKNLKKSEINRTNAKIKSLSKSLKLVLSKLDENCKS